MTAEPTRAVLYARLSRDKTGEAAGVTRQLEDARKLAELRGFVIVAEHTDNDISAAGSKRRPGFEGMLEDVTTKRASVVIAWAWDRLSRNRRDTLRLIEAGQENRLLVALVRGSDIDMSTASGRLVADLLAGVARAEIDSKSERQERAGLQRAEAGRPPSRRAFGYNLDGTPRPGEAEAVSEAFGLYLAGSTMVGLARHLNGNGFTSTRGRAWDDTGVRVMLSNPRYAGERYYRGERIGQGQWQPLVTPETFEAVRARLNDPAKAKRRPARKYLGSGLYRCHCGSLVRVNYAGDGTRTYCCAARRHMQRNAEPVDELVRAVIAERLRRADLAELTVDTGNAAEVGDLRRQALALRDRLDGVARDYADGALTARQLQVATKRIESSLIEVEGKLATAGRGSALAFIAGANDLGEAWLALPLDRQRAVLAALADVVILRGNPGRRAFDPSTVRIDWRAA